MADEALVDVAHFELELLTAVSFLEDVGQGKRLRFGLYLRLESGVSLKDLQKAQQEA